MKKFFNKNTLLTLAYIIPTILLTACGSGGLGADKSPFDDKNSSNLSLSCDKIATLPDCLQPMCMVYNNTCFDKALALQKENAEIQRINHLKSIEDLVELTILQDENYNPSNAVFIALNKKANELATHISNDNLAKENYHKAIIKNSRINPERREHSRNFLTAHEEEIRQGRKPAENLKQQQKEREEQEIRRKALEKQLDEAKRALKEAAGDPQATLHLSLDEILARDENLEAAQTIFNKKMSVDLRLRPGASTQEKEEELKKLPKYTLLLNTLKEVESKIARNLTATQKDRLILWLKNIFDTTYPQEVMWDGDLGKNILAHTNKEQRKMLYNFLDKTAPNNTHVLTHNNALITTKIVLYSNELDKNLFTIIDPDLVAELAFKLDGLSVHTREKFWPAYVLNKLVSYNHENNISTKNKIKMAVRNLFEQNTNFGFFAYVDTNNNVNVMWPKLKELFQDDYANLEKYIKNYIATLASDKQNRLIEVYNNLIKNNKMEKDASLESLLGIK